MSVSILYVCNEDRATTRQRLLALADLGVNTDVVYTSRLDEKPSLLRRVYRGILFRAGFFPERNNENRTVLDKMAAGKYDVLFVEKGLSLKPSTLARAKQIDPKIKIISYTLDDVLNSQNSSWYFKKSTGLFDIHFTNKRYNVPELRSLGARRAEYFRNAYSRHVHRPVHVSDRDITEFGADVGFIGTFEKERVEHIRFLAGNGIKVRVWGWGRSAASSGMAHPNIEMTDRYVYDDDYPRVVCASKINLCFLRKINRDTETTRSVELPACGGFMLAERTPDHQSLFEEGVEAEYFADKFELLEKVRYYLANPGARVRIAAAGRQRCLRDDYSYHNQLRKILNLTFGYEAIGNYNNASDPV